MKLLFAIAAGLFFLVTGCQSMDSLIFPSGIETLGAAQIQRATKKRRVSRFDSGS
jgi:hypothetical protein